MEPTVSANLMLKTRRVNQPYEVWRAHGYEWRVLKKYQADDAKPYARWYCATKGPGTFDSYDLGDAYAAEIKRHGVKVPETEWNLETWKDYQR
jgi:hypothetical protein